MVNFLFEVSLFVENKQQLEYHKKVSKNKSFGDSVMCSKDTKILKFNQHQNYDNTTPTIYADLESWIKGIE